MSILFFPYCNLTQGIILLIISPVELEIMDFEHIFFGISYISNKSKKYVKVGPNSVLLTTYPVVCNLKLGISTKY
jgi:hypothetical protein